MAKSDKKANKKVELKDFLAGIQAGHDQAAALAPESFGACLRTDPQTGQTTCIFTDSTTCQNIGGQFLGGPCS